jgi:hypothetical protein
MPRLVPPAATMPLMKSMKPMRHIGGAATNTKARKKKQRVTMEKPASKISARKPKKRARTKARKGIDSFTKELRVIMTKPASKNVLRRLNAKKKRDATARAGVGHWRYSFDERPSFLDDSDGPFDDWPLAIADTDIHESGSEDEWWERFAQSPPESGPVCVEQ